MKYQGITNQDCAIKAVNQDGDALQYVRDQTEAVCLAAVNQNGYALRYVRDNDMFVLIAEKIGESIEM